MRIQIITLFPDMFKPVLGTSMLKKAQDSNLVDFEYIDLREFGLGPHQNVDDTPFGGGDGMLLMIEPLVKAIEHAKAKDKTAKVILLSPAGETYLQSKAKALVKKSGLIVVCPRYEGYDERVLEWVDEVYSIGNYVLTGGEIPAMVVIDSVVRLIPGVLGGASSAEIESFQDDDITIEFPQYTRPEDFRGLRVPPILLSGHHANIEKWRGDHKKKL